MLESSIAPDPRRAALYYAPSTRCIGLAHGPDQGNRLSGPSLESYREPMTVKSFYGWKLLAVFWLVLLMTSSFTLYGGSVINPKMAAEFGTDPAYRGLPTSIYQFVFGLGALVVAVCVNRWGVRSTLVTGAVLMAVGAAAMASLIAAQMPGALVYGLVLGASAAAGGGIATQAGVARWFLRRRALAMAILFSAPGIGGFFVAPFLKRVIDASNGQWRMAWWVVAAAGALAVVIARTFVREQPSDLGQLADGAPAAAGAAGSQRRHCVFITEQEWTLAAVLRSTTLWVMLLAMLGMNMGFTLFFAVVFDHVRELGHTPTDATWSLAFFGISALLGKVALGTFGDRFDPRYVWAATLGGFAVGLHFIAAAHATGELVAAAIFLGFGWGGGIACMMAVLSNYYGVRVFPSIAGLAVAITTCGGSLIAMPFVAGRLHAAFTSYTPIFRGLALWCLVGMIAMLLVRRPQRRSP